MPGVCFFWKRPGTQRLNINIFARCQTVAIAFGSDKFTPPIFPKITIATPNIHITGF
ncbi:MAG TPA: hypothetical protein VK211_23790 [Kamptonema sp.]|nr:hypothetical protein [Kamptonema sp.]